MFTYKGCTVLSLRLKRQINAAHLFCSAVIARNQSTATMRAWQASQFGLKNLCLSPKDIPSILKPNDVLVKVCAASVNPIDVLMLDNGYGATTLETMRSFSDFGNALRNPSNPHTYGRDFVGEVVRIGHSVSDIQVNDKVWGVAMPQNQGSHAEYVVTSDFLVSQKPENITDVEAASIPYIGMTAWSTVVSYGNLVPDKCEGLQICVLGASGGIGTLFTQLLSVWGAKVTAICSKDSFELVRSCGAFEVFDREDPETLDILSYNPKFDLFIDAAGVNIREWTNTLNLTKNRRASLLTLRSPVLINIEEKGILQGTIESLSELIKLNTTYGPRIRWAFFSPSKEALQHIGKLIREEKIRPIIDKVFKMEDMLKAYEHVKDGRKRGKTVIDFAS